MKVMDSRSGLGAKRRHSGGYGEHLQQRHGCEGALSCFDISGLGYWAEEKILVNLTKNPLLWMVVYRLKGARKRPDTADISHRPGRSFLCSFRLRPARL